MTTLADPVTKDAWIEARKSRRYGRIAVSNLVMDDSPHLVAKLLTRFIPSFSSYDCLRDTTEYQGVSPDFRRVTAGSMLPQYHPAFDAQTNTVTIGDNTW